MTSSLTRLTALKSFIATLAARYRITWHMVGMVLSVFLVAFGGVWLGAGLALTSTALTAAVIAGVMASVHLAFPSVSGKQVSEMLDIASKQVGLVVPPVVLTELANAPAIPAAPAPAPISVTAAMPIAPRMVVVPLPNPPVVS